MKTKADLHLGDCVQVLSTLESESVDLTVTSPPYSDLRKYDGFSWDFCKTLEQLYRVTKKGGVVVWVVADKTHKGSESGDSFRQALGFMEIGFNLHDTMIYYRWSGPLTHNRYEQEFEYMFVFSKGRPNTFNPIMVDCSWHNKDGDRTGQILPVHDEIGKRFRSGKSRNTIHPKRIKGNVWKINNSSQAGERYGHPAPFPEQLANDHIISWSNIGDIVLDPFMGSGTTGKMAILNGRNFIGIELSPKYFETAKQRIDCLA